MEEHLQNDNLDDFVRKTFDDYEEDPSPNMWDRIEANMPSNDPQPMEVEKTFFLKSYRWQILAASFVVVLLSGLVAEYLYFTQKIKVLSEKNNSSISVEKPNTDATIQTKADPNSGTTPVTNLEKTAENGVQMPEGKSVDKNNDHETQMAAPANDPQLKKAATYVVGSSNHPLSGTNIENNPTIVQEITTPNEKIITPTIALGTPANNGHTSLVNGSTTADETGLSQISIKNIQKFEDISLLGNNFVPSPLALPNPPLSIPARMVKVHREPKGWYVGIHTSQGIQKENISDKDDDHHSPNDDHGFNNVVYSNDMWVRAGKKLTRRLSIESGIGFSNTLLKSAHQPNLKFRDGRPHHGGGPHHNHDLDFDYKIQTYGGSVSVALRMEQVDSMAQIDRDTPLSLQINTEERSQLIKIPVLAAYSFGNGRFSPHVKGGLTASFFLKNEFNITGLEDLEGVLQVSNGQKPQISKSSTPKVRLGYLFALGAEYRLTKSFSLIAEPQLTGDLNFLKNNRTRLPNRHTIGLNAGINYIF